MEHALSVGADGERVWSKRGTMTYRESSRYASLQTGQPGAVQLEAAQLDGPALEAFGRLVAEGGAYSVRIPSVLGEPASAPVVASVPACALLRAGFAELFTLRGDGRRSVGSLTYALLHHTTEQTCAPGTWQVRAGHAAPRQLHSRPPLARPHAFAAAAAAALRAQLPASARFESRVAVRAPVEGPVPRGRPAAPAESAGGGEGGKDKPKGPQSLLLKYWYLVAPAMLFMMMGKEPEPPAAQQAGQAAVTGGGGGGGGGGRAAARRA